MICELCQSQPSAFWRDEILSILDVNDADCPGFIRVVMKRHVAEMTDLTDEEYRHCMRVLMTAESVMREVLSPDKVNWAQFGNMVPHLHWHLIPRFKDDAYFPGSVWSARQRTTCAEILQRRQTQAQEMKRRLIQALNMEK